MIPVQVSLTTRQLRAFKDDAKRQEVSAQEIVRRVLDNYLDQRERELPA